MTARLDGHNGERANNFGFLDLVSEIGDLALIEWDRLAIDYSQWAADAERMWFMAPMNICRRVKFRRDRSEVPYATVHGCEVAAWLGDRWIMRDRGESASAFWNRVLT